MAFAALARKKGALLSLLLAAALGGGGFSTYRYYKKRQLERVQLDLSTLAKVEKGSLENKFQEVGEIAPKKFHNVASNVSGLVVQLPVSEGQFVKSGQTLAVIQPGRTAGEKFLPSTVAAPAAGVLLRPVEEERYGDSVKRFVAIDDYVTGRFDNAQSPTCLMMIADMKTLIVKLMINEVDVLKFREGMPVTVTVDALPEEKFDGTVGMISRQAEEHGRGGSAGKVFRTEITLKRNDERLRIGATARVSTVLDKKENALKMSLSGLFEEEGRSVAYLHVPDDKPREVEVKPGFRTPLEVEILSGLKDGDKVFTERPVEFVPLAPKAGETKPPEKTSG